MKKVNFCILFFLIITISYSQRLRFPEQHEFFWPDSKVKYDNIPDSLQKEDIVILSDEFRIHKGILIRRVAIKILTETGVKQISSVQLPENFDLSNFHNRFKQGRFKDQETPFYYNYDIRYFASRIIKPNNEIVELTPTTKYSKVNWVRRDGSHISQEVCSFIFPELKVNDIIEYVYKVELSNYRTPIYFNTSIPRLKLVLETNVNFDYCNVDPVDSVKFFIRKLREGGFHYEFKNLWPVYYSQFSSPVKSLPHIVFYEHKRPWLFITDSVSRKKYYSNEQNYFRKFSDQFIRAKDDSSGNKLIAQVVDSINKLKFVTAESMYYSRESQYAMTSSEHLAKGRLIEEFMTDVYDKILDEKKIFFMA